jgi:hypothetical protein
MASCCCVVVAIVCVPVAIALLLCLYVAASMLDVVCTARGWRLCVASLTWCMLVYVTKVTKLGALDGGKVCACMRARVKEKISYFIVMA